MEATIIPYVLATLASQLEAKVKLQNPNMSWLIKCIWGKGDMADILFLSEPFYKRSYVTALNMEMQQWKNNLLIAI